MRSVPASTPRPALPALATRLDEWVDRVRVQRFPHADHWLHHREADRVNRALIEFLQG